MLPSFFSAACKYGCDHEDKAQKEYALKMPAQHTRFSVTQSGLVIDPLHQLWEQDLMVLFSVTVVV